MKNWTEELIGQCLEGVPEGSYRERTKKELEDHLLALCRDLEEAGYAPEGARAAGLATRRSWPGAISGSGDGGPCGRGGWRRRS